MVTLWGLENRYFMQTFLFFLCKIQHCHRSKELLEWYRCRVVQEKYVFGGAFNKQVTVTGSILIVLKWPKMQKGRYSLSYVLWP